MLKFIVSFTLFFSLALGALQPKAALEAVVANLHARHLTAGEIAQHPDYIALGDHTACDATDMDNAYKGFLSSVDQLDGVDNITQALLKFSGVIGYMADPAVANCNTLFTSLFKFGPRKYNVQSTQCLKRQDDPTYADDECCGQCTSKCCKARTVKVEGMGPIAMRDDAKKLCKKPKELKAMWFGIYDYYLKNSQSCGTGLQTQASNVQDLITAINPCFGMTMNPFQACADGTECATGTCLLGYCTLPSAGEKSALFAKCLIETTADRPVLSLLMKRSLGVAASCSLEEFGAALEKELSVTTCSDNLNGETDQKLTKDTCTTQKYCRHDNKMQAASGSCGQSYCTLKGRNCNLNRVQVKCTGLCVHKPDNSTDQSTCTKTKYCNFRGDCDKNKCAELGFCAGDRTKNTKAKCEAAKYCVGTYGPGQVLPQFNANECKRCGGKMKSRNVWVSGQMVTGAWAETAWETDALASRNSWGLTLSSVSYANWIQKMAAIQLAGSFKTAMSCMIAPILKGLQQTAFNCGSDATDEKVECPVVIPVTKESSYTGISTKHSCGAGMSVTSDADSCEDPSGECPITCNVAIGTKANKIPGLSDDESDLVANVKSRIGSYVGTTVGNGIEVKADGSYLVCAALSGSVGKGMPSFALGNEASDELNDIGGEVTSTDSQYCATVSKAGIYYPFLRTTGAAGALEASISLLIVCLVVLFM
jgi:hypothetical protein